MFDNKVSAVRRVDPDGSAHWLLYARANLKKAGGRFVQVAKSVHDDLHAPYEPFQLINLEGYDRDGPGNVYFIAATNNPLDSDTIIGLVPINEGSSGTGNGAGESYIAITFSCDGVNWSKVTILVWSTGLEGRTYDHPVDGLLYEDGKLIFMVHNNVPHIAPQSSPHATEASKILKYELNVDKVRSLSAEAKSHLPGCPTSSSPPRPRPPPPRPRPPPPSSSPRPPFYWCNAYTCGQKECDAAPVCATSLSPPLPVAILQSRDPPAPVMPGASVAHDVSATSHSPAVPAGMASFDRPARSSSSPPPAANVVGPGSATEQSFVSPGANSPGDVSAGAAAVRRFLLVTGGILLIAAGLVTASCGTIEMKRSRAQQDSAEATPRRHRTGLPGAQRLEDEQETAEPRAEAPSRRQHKRVPRAAPEDDVEVALSVRAVSGTLPSAEQWPPPAQPNSLGTVRLGMD